MIDVMRGAAFVALVVLVAGCTAPPSAERGPSPAPTPLPNAAPTLVGTWTTTVSKEDLLRVVPDFKPEFLCANAGTFVWTFDVAGSFSIDQTALDDCPTPEATHIASTLSIAGNDVTFAEGTPDQEVYGWTVNGDQLTFEHRSGGCIPCQATNTANPWQRTNE